MKNIKYLIQTFFVISILIVSSCKKSFYTDANVNPNAPPSVTPASLLSSAEGALAYTQGGTFSLFTSLFTQQIQGAAQQAAAYNNYIVTSQDLDDPWSTWYTNVMASCKDLISQSDAKGYNRYAGIGRLLLAYSLQLNVDAWGDIPYSQAFKGVLNLNPSYDKAAGLYDTIGTLVDNGIAQLNASPGGLVPGGSDDRIYGGTAASWIKFGHAIKARLAIHQSKNNSAMATKALTEVGLSFANNGDNAVYPFGTTETSSNPWYQFNEERSGYVSFKGSTLASILTSLNDPRYPIFIDSAGEDATGIGLATYYGGVSSPIELITYDELLFITAEADLRTGNAVGAQTAYTDAITAAMQKVGVDTSAITTYLGAHGTLPATVTDAIDSVSTQEYLSLYLNPETWALWRRTGSPSLTATAGTNGVPRRLRYPQTEYFYNTDNVNAEGSVTLWSPKLFWDN